MFITLVRKQVLHIWEILHMWETLLCLWELLHLENFITLVGPIFSALHAHSTCL